MLGCTDHPLEDALRGGITVDSVRQLLEANGCLDFPQFKSGMFPACNLDDLNYSPTGMANSWLRDTAAVALALLEDGQTVVVARAAYGTLDCLSKIADSMRQAVEAGHAPKNDRLRPAVSFTGERSEPRRDWVNTQNDALGYALQLIGASISAGILQLVDEHEALLHLVIGYLHAIKYWQDADRGHWEEDKRVNASSIGAVIAGLRAVRHQFNDASAIDELIDKGEQAMVKILPSESLTPVERAYDSALLLLVEPMGVVTGNMAAQIVDNTEQHLVGSYGIRRYIGDSYWAPDYRAHLEQSARAADFSGAAGLARRNKLLTSGNEAQWTIFDPILSAYYARLYSTNQIQAYKDSSIKYLTRSLRSVITHRQPDSGKTVWRVPEAYFLENRRWLPNDHLGLLWAQANLIHALNLFKSAFADTLLLDYPN